MSRYIVAISGASGSAYGVAVIKGLVGAGAEVVVTATREGLMILKEEVGFDWAGLDEADAERRIEEDLQLGRGTIAFFAEDNLHASISSGSFKTSGMVVAPCSMKTLAGIANGYANNLVERAADVCLKERRTLVLIPRETPLSAIHLENMLKLSRMGVHILAAMPGFYHKPRTIDDIVNSIAGRALDLLGVENALTPRWGG